MFTMVILKDVLLKMLYLCSKDLIPTVKDNFLDGK